MIWYHGKIVLISALFSIAQLNIGCSPRYEVKILDLKERTEEVFCEEHPNAVARPYSLQNSTFYVVAWYSKDLRKNIVGIKARKDDSSPVLTVGENLQEGDMFNFQKSKWEILKIGNDGVTVNGMEWCRGGFVHIKQV
jgi:hypothetical protein